MNGSLTATSSTSSLWRATLATKRPILPNPNRIIEEDQTHKPVSYLSTSTYMIYVVTVLDENEKEIGIEIRSSKKSSTVDSDLDLLIRTCKNKINQRPNKILTY